VLIVCKLRDAPYRSGDHASWLKTKCREHGVFQIIGFIPAPGAIASLHLARREGKALAYVGRAGREGLLRHASFKGLQTRRARS
jgi:bifunctional non-homologous end joining protein LigD